MVHCGTFVREVCGKDKNLPTGHMIRWVASTAGVQSTLQHIEVYHLFFIDNIFLIFFVLAELVSVTTSSIITTGTREH